MTDDTNLQRVFFALWPDDHLRVRLAALARRMPADGRLVPPEHLHLTLAFPGTVSSEVVAGLIRRAGAIRGAPIHLRLDHLGHFPGPRVAWLGSAKTPPELAALAASLQGVCRDSRVRLDDRPFRPHVTLRRFVTRFESVPIEPLEWRTDRMVLVESGQRGHPGPYRVLCSWALEGAPVTGPGSA